MTIRLASSEDREKWDQYVLTHPDGSPYHLYAWKMSVEDAYSHRCYYLIAESNDQIYGVLPLVYLKPPLQRGQLVSLPFCDLGGLLSNCDKVQKQLTMESVSIAGKLNAKLIELRSSYTQDTSFNDSGLLVSTESHKVSMLLRLPQSSEELWSSFKSKLRSQIRKAEKNGLRFIWGDIDNFDSFYLVFSQNMRDLGSPVHSKKWIRAILQYYGQNARMGLVYLDTTVIGCGIILSTGNKVCIPWASTLRDYNRFSPNMLIYWNFLKHSADNGYSLFDFGRSTPDEGTYKFKMQWGAKPAPLCWQKIIMDGKELELQTTSSSKREKIERIWQKLPLGVANYIGPVIRRYISL